ncbi:MAG: ChbG/HpnK family deacetylase [Syntrophobacteraceae bacterium]|nr:ChbG/HpnK family deacetylase [Syntrophobacteraceae bacterium]
MLIINADDWGVNRTCTNRILDCYRNDRITSTTAMLFMNDSLRASEVAREHGLPVGLHLNFTREFDNTRGGAVLNDHQKRLVTYFSKSKYIRTIYNPVIRNSILYSFMSQYDEFIKIFMKTPTHVDGHHHIHLCMNIICDNIIPDNMKIRPRLCGSGGEKNICAILYGKLIDYIIHHRYRVIGSVYKLDVSRSDSKLSEIVNRAVIQNVELITHPARLEEYEYLKTESYARLISRALPGSYGSIGD